MRTYTPFAVLLLIASLLVACGPGATSSPSGSVAASASASAGASASAEPSASPSGDASAAPSGSGTAGGVSAECMADNLATKSAGTLTIGTDNPAFPPYYDPEPADPAWELGNPNNGKGFEAAVAYAIAEELGFSEEQVEWIAVKFDLSFAPGPKDFDIYLTQVSDTPERRESADLSEGYYDLNQALVAVADTPIASATSFEELKEYTFGAQVGTTSLAYIEEEIQPNEDPLVYDTNDAAIAALNNAQIDGLVVDLPTAFFITAAQMENGTIVGQFPPAEGEQEHFSVVLEKDSPLTDCVNEAIAALEESGDLEAITQEWMSENAGAPVLE